MAMGLVLGLRMLHEDTLWLVSGIALDNDPKFA